MNTGPEFSGFDHTGPLVHMNAYLDERDLRLEPQLLIPGEEVVLRLNRQFDPIPKELPYVAQDRLSLLTRTFSPSREYTVLEYEPISPKVKYEPLLVNNLGIIADYDGVGEFGYILPAAVSEGILPYTKWFRETLRQFKKNRRDQ